MSEFGVELPEQTEFDLSDSEYLEANVQSVSIEEYWLILEEVDSSYESIKQVAKHAHDDLAWYKRKFNEAENLCKDKNLKSLKLVQETEISFSSPKKFSHDAMNSTLDEITSKLNSLTLKKEEKRSVIEKLEQESRKVLDTLNESIENTQKNIDMIKSELNNKQDKILLHSSQIEQLKSQILVLKTTRMKYVVALCLVFVTMLLITKGVKGVIIAITVTFFAFFIF